MDLKNLTRIRDLAESGVSLSRFARDAIGAISQIEDRKIATCAVYHALKFSGIDVSLTRMNIVEGVNLGNLEVIPPLEPNQVVVQSPWLEAPVTDDEAKDYAE
eukprot:2566547-Pyramimonas_sp.AAC.1